METRRLLTYVLLLFVAVSLAVALVKQWRRQSDTPRAAAVPTRPDALVLYCFHNTVRCATCNHFESFTRDLLQAEFAAPLGAGPIEFCVLDEEQPANQPLRDAYGVVGPALVLVQFDRGQARTWENLEEAVTLVDHRERFQAYVRGRIQAHLAARGGAEVRP